MIIFSFVYSADFLIESLARYRRSSSSRQILLAIKLFALVLLLPCAVFVFFQGAWIVSLFFVFVSFLLFFSYHIDYWLARRSFTKSPYGNESYTIELSDEWFHVKSPKQDTKLTWSVFSKAVYFNDGFLLFHGPRLFNWLPFSALVDSKQKPELEKLLRKKIKIHQAVEK